MSDHQRIALLKKQGFLFIGTDNAGDRKAIFLSHWTLRDQHIDAGFGEHSPHKHMKVERTYSVQADGTLHLLS